MGVGGGGGRWAGQGWGGVGDGKKETETLYLMALVLRRGAFSLPGGSFACRLSAVGGSWLHLSGAQLL